MLLSLGVASATPASGAVVEHAVSEDPAAVSDYWTEQRMRNAVPLDSPETAGAIAGGKAQSSIAAPPDQETSPANDTLYPQRLHGILFFKIGVIDASCSATVVTSFSRDVILTAGHCLATPGPQLGETTFSTNVLFVPGYRNGVMPFGAFPATVLRTPGPWAFEGDITLDVGAANLAPGGGGLIQDQLGSRGVTFSKPLNSYKGRAFEIFGYPGSPPEFYDAERLILCVSPFIGFERGVGALGASPCHQQEGSSGGGWVLSGGLVNSVVSHGGCAVPSTACTVIAGTYFGDAAFKIWAAAAGGLPNGRKKRIRACKRIEKASKFVRCLNRAQTFQPIVG